MPEKELYATRLSAGLCPACGNRPLPPGKRRCEECRVAGLDTGAARVVRLKDARLCRKCGAKPIVVGRRMCADCLEYYRARYHLRKHAALVDQQGASDIDCGPDRYVCELLPSGWAVIDAELQRVVVFDGIEQHCMDEEAASTLSFALNVFDARMIASRASACP